MLYPAANPDDDDRALVRATFDSAPDALVVIGPGGRQVAMNARFLALWNFPPELLARRDLDEMRRHVAQQLADPEAYWRGIRTMEGMTVSAVLDELVLRDGRVYERHVSPLHDCGFPGAVVVRWRDITSRAQAQQALAQALGRLAAVFEHAREAIVLVDDGMAIVDLNPAACALLGRTREQLLRLPLADAGLSAPAALDGAWPGLLRAGMASGEAPLRRADGGLRTARVNAVAHIQPGLHLAILSDVTDEAAFRMRQHELSTQMDIAMSSAELVFWVVDLRQDRVTLADPRWASRFLGYDSAELGDSANALDPLVHPDDLERREAAWQAHLQGRTAVFECEFRVRHRDGRWLWVLTRGRAIERDASGRALRLAGIRIDITRRKLAEQELEARAFTDGLTGVLNRRRFIELAEIEVSRAQRHQQPVALLMVDLDHFKSVNDRHGHAGGDAVLRTFAATAQAVMRGSDLLGRVGGEEFAALLPQTDLAGAAALAQRLQELVRGHPAPLPGGPVAYTASIGVAAHAGRDGSGASVEALMLAADAALYRAKGQGRDRVLLADGPGAGAVPG
ncbi:MAG: diguanylate cyclase [Rubrivivax sp.]